MRSLVISLYILVLGCMLLISFVVEQWGNEYYKQDISNQYLDYAHMLTPIIEKDIIAKPEQLAQTLAYWSKIIEEDDDAITLITLDKTQHVDGVFVETLAIDDQADYLHIISPLEGQTLQGKALSFTFYDSYSDSFIIQYYLGRLIIYAVMTLILTLIAWLVYRYINQISQVAKSVSQGDFSHKMPTSRIHALQNLASDINNMASSLEEKNNENLILTGAIHHELRIPITRIRLALDMLIQSKQETSSLELLTDMDDDLEELSSLMEALLTISRLRLTGVEIDKENLSLSHVLSQLLKPLDQSKIELTCQDDFQLFANKTLLDRALLNIINNAIKYSNKIVRITAKRDAGGYQICVEDDGMGIPETERDLILKPFYRTDKSRNRNTGGFGLGLAIADLVIKDCQGQINITQSPLGGASISISWQCD